MADSLNDSDMLTAALTYAAQGISIFPAHGITSRGRCTCGKACTSAGKHPRTERGHLDATTDTDTITAWWTRWPSANIAIPMKANGLIAIDVDERAGGDETIATLRKRLGVEGDLWTSRTGNGYHLIARAPTGLHAVGSLGPGVDVKHDGYVIGPPSKHSSGVCYGWEDAYSPESIPEPPPLQPAYLEAVTQRPDKPDENRRPLLEVITEGTNYGENRNSETTRYAGYIRNHHPIEIGLEIVRDYNANKNRPPLPDDEIKRMVVGHYARYEQPPTPYLSPKTELEIFTGPEFMQRPPVPWLVRGLLPERGFAAVVGHPGSFKSFFALDLALCIAAGRDWHGHTVASGPVLYVLSEGQGGFSKRMQAWQQATGVKVPDSFFILPDALPILQPATVAKLIDAIMAATGGEAPRLVVFDTLSRAIAGENENASETMSKVNEAANALQQLGSAVLIIHHATKADGRIRGHGSLFAALDSEITLQREQGSDLVRVSLTKQKDDEEGQPILLKRRVIDIGDGGRVLTADERRTSIILEPISGPELDAMRETKRWSGLTEKHVEALTYLSRFKDGLTTDEWFRGLKKEGIYSKTAKPWPGPLPGNLPEAAVTTVPNAYPLRYIVTDMWRKREGETE